LKTSWNSLETLLRWSSTRPVDPVVKGREAVPRTPTVIVGVTVGVEVGDIVGALRSPLIQAPLI